jgi:hypothetical protein
LSVQDDTSAFRMTLERSGLDWKFIPVHRSKTAIQD